MRYSLWSRGRLLGHSTLDFYPFRTCRMGWLELTELGERFVDTLESLEFELRDGKGVIVPTVHVSVQDTDRLVALAEVVDDDEIEAEVDAEVARMDDEFEAALIELGMTEPPTWDEPSEVGGAEWIEETELPRFQVFVDLVRADSVPVADRWKDDPDIQEMLHDARRDRDDSTA